MSWRSSNLEFFGLDLKSPYKYYNYALFKET
jgi:hypothetical protein